MTGYEQDFIYKTIPRLTEAINNLSSKLESPKNVNPFYEALDKAGITTEDFTGYIGCILGANTAEDPEQDSALIKSSWDFMEKLYKIASENL